METRATVITSQKNKAIEIKIIPGHFATSHSHINYYIDMTGLKSIAAKAKDAAAEIAPFYSTRTVADTIICMDGCEIIGAFLANELSGVCDNRDIAVISPEYNTNGQMLFRDNVQNLVWNKNIILLIASATTGKTINRLMECVQYYGGNTVGISAIFSAINSINGVDVNMLFSSNDLPDYEAYNFTECPHCKNKMKIDAIVNSSGYSKI